MGEEYFWGVDLYFISCARELCMGGNIVKAVEDLKMHFYRAAVLIYGRGLFLGWLIYILYHARELWVGGNIVEVVEDLKMHFYRAAVL